MNKAITRGIMAFAALLYIFYMLFQMPSVGFYLLAGKVKYMRRVGVPRLLSSPS